MYAFTSGRWDFLLTAIIAIMPIALATMIEHIGDICAIGSTTDRNYLENPGLHRTLMGDGAATILASLFGAPANTTYGENTGVLNLTRVFDPRVVRIAAVIAILFSFSPKFAALIYAMPAATIGGVSLILSSDSQEDQFCNPCQSTRDVLPHERPRDCGMHTREQDALHR